MSLLFKVLFWLSAIVNLINGIQIWVTGKPETIPAQVVDNFTLFAFFSLFALSAIDSRKVKKNETH
ncbi:hypothetical protein ABES03_08450 [Neobacillus rhizosphaerae]|uniref:hypothetical protein n=1 Tax=Neobacillus rhizosphaerae TaxID=2880965 RepID=UPI003D2C6872